MKRWHKCIISIAVLLLLSVCFVAFILPGIVKNQAIEKVRTTTGRILTIGDISLNPFTWEAEVRDVRLTERDHKTTFASFSSVQVVVSPKTIIAAAPVVTEVRIVSPYAHLVRTAANTYNFSDLLVSKEKKKETGKLPEFSLNNITIEKGSIDFIDQALPREKRHTIRSLAVGVPFVSTIPHYAERYIQPYLRAVVNDSPFEIGGKLKPFAQAAEYSLSLHLKNVDLPYYLAYVPAHLPVTVRKGIAGADLACTYRVAARKKPELMLRGSARLDGLDIQETTGAPLASLKGFTAGGISASLLAGQCVISLLEFDTLKLHLSRDGRGIWNLEHLSGDKEGRAEAHPRNEPKEKPGKRPEEESSPALFEVAKVSLKNGEVVFDDRMPPGGFHGSLQRIAIEIDRLSTAKEKTAEYAISFDASRGGKGAVQGRLALTPVAVTSAVEFKGVALDTYYPYLATALTAPVKGSADLSGNLTFGAESGLRLDRVNLGLRDFSAPFGKGEYARFKQINVDDGRYNQKDQRLEVAAVTFNGADIRFSRDTKGRLSPLTLLRQETKAQASPRTVSHSAEGQKTRPFSYKIGRVSGTGISADFTDHWVEDSPAFSLKRGVFSLQSLTGPVQGPLTYRLSAGFGDSGGIKSAGTVRLNPLRIKGETTLTQIPLDAAIPYLPEGIDLVLADGDLDVALTYDLFKGKDGLRGTFSGSAGVRSFHALDSEGEDLLKWDRLQLEDVSGTLAPLALSVDNISLSKYYARIIIDRDGRLNLQKLYVPTAAPPAAPVHAAEAPTGAPPARDSRISIRTVTLAEGTLNFTDRHMPGREYATSMYELGGRVSGLTSEGSKYADVDLRGNLENHSPLLISGKINPLQKELYADLVARFSDIELTPLTPYSGTYVGYSVDRGKLSLELRYKIENKQLNSENKVFIDQFTFGRKIESDKATNLPVRLAVALLKDRKGEIHLDLPVTGRTDDPKFSVWGVVWKMVKNLLVKAATSPFALLQGVFGGGENFAAVSFRPGSARLSPAEEQKLLKLAQALNDRPALKIDIKAYVDNERDPEGYRAESITRKMKAEKFLELVKEKRNQPGDSIDTMTIAPEESSRYLRAVYKKEKFPKPRNMLGLVKDLPDAEMRKLITAHTVVGSAELKALAAERAAAVRSFLAQGGKVAPVRLFQKDDDLYKAPPEGFGASRVEFGVAVD